MNLWTLFQQTVNQGGPIAIGEVTQIYSEFGDVQIDVQVLPGDAIVRVKATGRSLEIGQRWLIQDGVAIEEAPNTEVFLIAI